MNERTDRQISDERIAELQEKIKAGWEPQTPEELDEISIAIKQIHIRLRGEFKSKKKTPAKKKTSSTPARTSTGS